MPAYIIVDVEIHDPKVYDQYKKLTPISVEKYGGRFIVRGGATETLEGQWAPGRVVVIEFPTMEKAKEWWASSDYAEAKNIRQSCSSADLIVVQGAV